MSNKITLQTQAKFLKLKAVLNQVQDASFQYMQLNKRIDINDLSETKALELIDIFSTYINDLYKVLERYQNED